MLTFSLFFATGAQNEIGFIETFALAEDRESTLSLLVPGTEEAYFFRALHFQNTQQREKLAEVLQQWAKRYPQSERRKVIERRESLLAFDTDPQKTIDFLREQFRPNLDHIQLVQNQKPSLPTVLDPARIDRSIYLQAALASDDLEGMGEAQLEALVREKTALRPPQLRSLLSKLQRPDVDGLLDRVIEDLRSRESKGFGEWDIHRALLPAQLAELGKALPSVRNQSVFVAATLRQLAPSIEDDVRPQTAGRTAWLERLYTAVSPLSASFNSLKAWVFYARLQDDRSRGVYSRDRFIEYLKLPRSQPYVNPAWLERTSDQQRWVNLNLNFDDYSLGLPAIGQDEPLIREFLLHFAQEDADWQVWTEWLAESWVKPIFAEAKITSGVGDPEKWASLLTPSAYQTLRDRVDIEFSPTNSSQFFPEDEVSLEVFLKNSPKLIVKIFELNTLGLALAQNRQPGTDLNLDGLVANEEQVHEINESPFRRISRRFKFPQLQGKRGAWMVEFIGGGKSSRALIRKGGFSLIQQDSPAGDLLAVLDEREVPVTNAVAWLDGRQWPADAMTGLVLIPFAEKKSERSIILANADGSFATLNRFLQHAESYDLHARFHLEREQLLAGRDATVLVRPTILIGDSRVSPGLLESPKLTITTTTHEGIHTTSEVPVTGLAENHLYAHTFRVADRLAKIHVVLSGKVTKLSPGAGQQELSATEEWDINGSDSTDATYSAHLSHFVDGYRFELLGKNGEAIRDQPITFDLFRSGYAQPQTVELQTDEQGKILLGTLSSVSSVRAHLPHDQSQQWDLHFAGRKSIEAIHALAGELIQVPWLGPVDGSSVSLLETRGHALLEVPGVKLQKKGGFLEITGLPSGDYSLRLQGEESEEITLRISSGHSLGPWLASANRVLTSTGRTSLQVESVQVGTNEVTVQLRSWDAFTRVQVAALRFLPPHRMGDTIGQFPVPTATARILENISSYYTGGREIGDEYRYILDRRYLTKYPGNLLTRPSLILNPWERRETETHTLDSRVAQRAQSVALNTNGLPPGGLASMAAEAFAQTALDGNLDYLAESAPLLYNLGLDADGRVHIPKSALKDRPWLQIYAENLDAAVWTTADLPGQTTAFRDRRLAKPLEPSKPFAQKREVTRLQAGEKLVISDSSNSELEIYDSVASVHSLLTSLSHNTNLVQFAWILNWSSLKEEEKKAKYSEFACHELNFFLSRKDPVFFHRVVQPYLRNKKDKTFLDEYLLELPLDSYLEPSRYQRLNAAERALLGHRLPGQEESTRRRLRELWELLPTQPDQDAGRFEAALRGRGLEASAGENGRGEWGVAIRPSAVTGLPSSSPKDLSAVPQLMELGDPAAGRAMFRMKSATLESPVLRESTSYFGLTETDGLRRLGRDAAYYRQLGATKEWAENNYYQVLIKDQGPELIPVNGFWVDYAAWDGEQPFLSSRFTEATHNFSDMMLALAVLDIPFAATNHIQKTEGIIHTLTAGSPLIAFHQQIRVAEAPMEAGSPGILVSENFFRDDDRYREEENERFDKFVTGEFLSGVVYGARVVFSNPGSAMAKLDILTQIPQGALPVSGSKATQSRYLQLAPYATEQVEYHFYFPTVPTNSAPFDHFSASLTSSGRAIARASQQSFHVVTQLSRPDTTSWEYISQIASEDEVMGYLEHHNLEKIEWEKIAWRARTNPAFFKRITDYLATHHVWNDTLYAYGLVHKDGAALRQWLRHHPDFLASCGPSLTCSLVQYDATEQHRFEHLEFAPIVNQRIHRLGAERRIANQGLLQQYQSFLETVAFKPTLSPSDSLDIVYYLLVQDRIEEALARFHKLPVDRLNTRLQYDYLRCYVDFYEEQLSDARGLAVQYADYPVDRWRGRFTEVLSQLDEIEGKKANRTENTNDRDRRQAELASAAQSFTFQVEDRKLRLNWKNLHEVTIRYYLMDPELLFSSSPFVSGDAGRFSIIRPGLEQRQALPDQQDSLEIPLPGQLAQANVLIEILGGGQRQVQAYHANTFKLQIAETFGQLEVRDQVSGKPVSKAYVKAYARLKSGEVRFMKDGYTDLRGKFDYSSLNSGGGGQGASGATIQALGPQEIGNIERIAILVISETHGTAVREVNPPKS